MGDSGNYKRLQGFKEWIPQGEREDLKQWISNAESMGTTFGQITLALYYIGGSQRAYFVLQGTFSDVWGYFWLSCWGMGNATGIYWLESRETAKHHTMYRTAPAPTVKNYLDQAVYSATVKETLHYPHARLPILPAAAQKLSRKRISGSGICLTRKAKATRWLKKDPQVSTPRPAPPPMPPTLTRPVQVWQWSLSKSDFTIVALLSLQTLGNLKIFTKSPKSLWKFPGRQDSKLQLAFLDKKGKRGRKETVDDSGRSKWSLLPQAIGSLDPYRSLYLQMKPFALWLP